MSGAVHPLLQYVFMAWCLVKHRDNFTYFLLMDIIYCSFDMLATHGLGVTGIRRIKVSEIKTSGPVAGYTCLDRIGKIQKCVRNVRI